MGGSTDESSVKVHMKLKPMHYTKWAAAACLVYTSQLLLLVRSQSDLPDKNAGRLDLHYPSPRCCQSVDCVQRDQGRHAFLTMVRSESYMLLVRELQCSLKKHNPGAHLIVAAVAGDLQPTTIAEIRGFAEYLELENYSFGNSKSARFSQNWVKLRAWGLEQYDAIIMLDADGVVLGDLMHLFTLPTDFASTVEQGPMLSWNTGGFVFLRPCRAVMEHMFKLLDVDHFLRFSDGFAEQDFLMWYFRFLGMRLSMSYNANHHWYRATGERTAGGDQALFLHFADSKPFELNDGAHEWKYMCHRKRQYARPHVKSLGPSTVSPMA